MKKQESLQFTKTDHEIIRKAVSCLPMEQKKVVILKFWENLEIPEIAEELGLRINQVKNLLALSFRNLKEACLSDPSFSRFASHQWTTISMPQA